MQTLTVEERNRHGRVMHQAPAAQSTNISLSTAHQGLVREVIRSPRAHAKLAIGAPDDASELEADRVADQVLSMPDLQPLEPAEAQEDEEEPEQMALAKPVAGGASMDPEIESRIHSLQGGGQPLPSSVRAYFEPRFRRDFSAIRVHTDSPAAETARTLRARAFTSGRDVVFAAGEYAPESAEGRRLLAHELAHTVQQAAISVPSESSLSESADTAGRASGAVAGGAAATVTRQADATVQRRTVRENYGTAVQYGKAIGPPWDVGLVIVGAPEEATEDFTDFESACMDGIRNAIYAMVRPPEGGRREVTVRIHYRPKFEYSDIQDEAYRLAVASVTPPEREKTPEKSGGPQKPGAGHPTPAKEQLPEVGEQQGVDLIGAACQLLWRTAYGSDWRQPQPPPGTPQVYVDMLWDFWTAGSGLDFVAAKEEPASPEARLKHLESGKTRLQPLVERWKRSDPKVANEYVSAYLEKYLHEIELAALQRQAEQVASAAVQGEAVERLDPKFAGDTRLLLGNIDETIKLLAQATDAVNRLKEHEFNEALHELSRQNKLAEGTPLLVLKNLKSSLDLASAILTVSDPRKREEMAEELHKALGETGWARAAGVGASLSEMAALATKALAGTLAVTATMGGVAARLAGYSDVAAKCFALTRVVNKVNLALEIIEVVHGAFVLADPNATAEKKAEAVRDIALGTTGILTYLELISGTAAFAVSVGIVATWYSTKWSLEQGAAFMGAAIRIELNEAYKTMREDGMAIAQQFVYCDTLFQLTRETEAKDPKHAAGYELALARALDALREPLAKAYNHGVIDGRGLPGHWPPMQRRFQAMENAVREAIDRKTPPEIVLLAARGMLELMMDLYRDYGAVLSEAYGNKPEARKKEEAGYD